MKNTIVAIGYLGNKECYLNLSVEEAKERFRKEHYGPEEEADPDEFDVKVIEFTDHFCVYDIWEA